MKKFITSMFAFFVIIILLAVGITVFLHTAKFGRHPQGDRLTTIKKSSNYQKGQFKNLSPTPMLTEGENYFTVTLAFIKSNPKTPKSRLPSQKTDLHNLQPNENILVWMGHSSYFMQVDGLTFLVDPVFSGSASLVSFTTRAYPGSDIYRIDEIPQIDYLLISHDHWDHLDYETILSLKSKVKKVISGLGVGEHLESWGYDPMAIIERDWYETAIDSEQIKIYITPSRHFSGRGLRRDKSLWSSFVIHTPSARIFYSGDSGYGEHFKDIGKKYGPFDLAILENGQYNYAWKYLHMFPKEAVKVASELDALAMLPVHLGKFTLSSHDWDEPLKDAVKYGEDAGMRVITPMIGEMVKINSRSQTFKKWWLSVK